MDNYQALISFAQANAANPILVAKTVGAWICASLLPKSTLDGELETGADVANTLGGSCGWRDILLQDIMASIGVEARRVNVYDVPFQVGHSATEIKINGKWVFFDSTFGLFFTNKSGDMLSLLEARNTWPDIDTNIYRGNIQYGVSQPLDDINVNNYKISKTTFLYIDSDYTYGQNENIVNGEINSLYFNKVVELISNGKREDFDSNLSVKITKDSGTNAWDTIQSNYVNGKLHYKRITNDNLTHDFYYYDSSNTLSYSYIKVTTGVGNYIKKQDTYYDNGQYEIKYFSLSDPASSNYSVSYFNSFKLRYQSTNISNGDTTEINIYDCNSLYNWKQLTVQFLDSDELRVSATYDTGSSSYINFTNEYIYSTATTIRGTSLADLFIGDSGHDLFISNGGGDIALGGKGDDTYIISSSSDVIIESFNEGYDSVRSYVSLSLPENVEYGSVLGNALNITGNVLDNYIAGNSLDNSLVGGDGNDIIRGLNGKDTLSGGKGYDTLYGGAGADQFIFDVSLSSGNADVLKDFQSGVDKLVLDDDIFTRFTGKKVVGSGSFIIGNKPLDSNDYLIYDLTTDTLYYDADGAGAQFGHIAIAKIELSGQSSPTFTDFVVVA
jgi:Ca2+-binding RTX toxin-like protein